MIKKVHIQNFMSIADVTIHLQPLTVFIGLNGSGKSAIFKALVCLSKLFGGSALRGPQGDFALEPGIGFDELVWKGDAALPIVFEVWIDDPESLPNYQLELRKRYEGWSVVREIIRYDDVLIEVNEHLAFEHNTERRGVQRHMAPMRAILRYLVHPYKNDSIAHNEILPIFEFARRIGRIWRYRPSADDIASFVSYPSSEDGKFSSVVPNGYGVARKLQELQGRDRVNFEKIECAICGVFPHVNGLGFDTDWQGVRVNYSTHRSVRPISAPQESDGVLLATFLFWRLYTSGGQSTICLEEPENGLHPLLLADRWKILRKFARGEQEVEPTQILIATHSSEFLRALKAHPRDLLNEVRLVEFDPATGTSVRGLHSIAEPRRLLRRFLEEELGNWTT